MRLFCIHETNFAKLYGSERWGRLLKLPALCRKTSFLEVFPYPFLCYCDSIECLLSFPLFASAQKNLLS